MKEKSVMAMEAEDEGSCSPRSCVRFFSKGTIFSSIFNLLTTCIGAGTLSLPYAFSQGGLVYSSIVFFLILIMAVLIGFLLYDAKRYSHEICPGLEVKGYEDLAEASFGVLGRIFVLAVLFGFLFLTLIAYMIYTRDQLSFVIQFFIHISHHVPQCSLLTNCAIVMCIGFLPLFPVLLLKSISLLQFTSTASIFCIGFFAIVLAIKTSLYFQDGNSIIIETLTSSDVETIGLFPSSIKGAITCLSYCSLTFLCQFQLFSLEKELNRPRRWKLNFIIIASMVLAYVLYNIVAFAGYLQFGGTTPEDIMTRYPSTDKLVTALRIALFFTLLFSYPILFHPTRLALNRLVSYCYELYSNRGNNNTLSCEATDETTELLISSTLQSRLLRYRKDNTVERKELKPNWLVWICESWALFATTFLSASFIPNVGYVWSFVGAIGGSLVLYILPALFYLRLHYFIRLKTAGETSSSLMQQYRQCSVWKDLVALTILVMGVIVLIAGNYEAIDSIVHHSHDGGVHCSSLQCLHIDNSSSLYE